MLVEFQDKVELRLLCLIVVKIVTRFLFELVVSAKATSSIYMPSDHVNKPSQSLLCMTNSAVVNAAAMREARC